MKAATTPLTRLAHGRFALWCAALLAVESFLILAFASEEGVMGGDGPEYVSYATNLVEHGVYSRDSAPPFEPSVHRTPGYPLFLAGLRVIGGDSVLLVRLTQFALLGLLAWLAYQIVLELADRVAARITAMLVLTYMPFLWIARMHLTEILTSTLVAAIVLLMLRASRARDYAAIGVLCGITALVRPIFTFAAAPIALAALLSSGSRSRLLSAGAVVAGLVVVLAPWTIRNLALTGELRPFGAGGGGISLFASAKQYQGSIGYRFDEAELSQLFEAAGPAFTRGREKARTEPSDTPLNVREEIAMDEELRSEARSIASRLDAIDAARTVPKRIAYLWSVSDYAPIAGYEVWHWIARLQHFAILILAAGGAVLTVRMLGARGWPLFLFPAYLVLAHLVVHSEGRYSIPARASVIALSAIALAWTYDRARQRRTTSASNVG